MRAFLLAILYLPLFVFSQEDYRVTLDQGLPTLSMRVETVPEDLDSYIDLHMLMIADEPYPNQISGKYWQENGWIFFQPHKRLQGGRAFVAKFNFPTDTINYKFKIPKGIDPAAPPSEVIEIYPINGKVPSNVLFIHTRFKHPMLESREAYEHVKLIRNDTVQDLTWRHKAFWLDDGKLLVLMVHPGRVKSGIDYLSEKGELFVEGDTVLIQVTTKLKDAGDRFLTKSFEKSFIVGPPDREIPKIRYDDFKLPKEGQPYFEFVFNESMNYASIIDGVTFHEEDGGQVRGVLKEVDDRTFRFTPLSFEWKPGKYHIIFSEIVADLANNRLNRPFEIEDVDDKLKDVPVVWEFTID